MHSNRKTSLDDAAQFQRTLAVLYAIKQGRLDRLRYYLLSSPVALNIPDEYLIVLAVAYQQLDVLKFLVNELHFSPNLVQSWLAGNLDTSVLKEYELQLPKCNDVLNEMIHFKMNHMLNYLITNLDLNLSPFASIDKLKAAVINNDVLTLEILVNDLKCPLKSARYHWLEECDRLAPIYEDFGDQGSNYKKVSYYNGSEISKHFDYSHAYILAADRECIAVMDWIMKNHAELITKDDSERVFALATERRPKLKDYLYQSIILNDNVNLLHDMLTSTFNSDYSYSKISMFDKLNFKIGLIVKDAVNNHAYQVLEKLIHSHPLMVDVTTEKYLQDQARFNPKLYEALKPYFEVLNISERGLAKADIDKINIISKACHEAEFKKFFLDKMIKSDQLDVLLEASTRKMLVFDRDIVRLAAIQSVECGSVKILKWLIEDFAQHFILKTWRDLDSLSKKQPAVREILQPYLQQNLKRPLDITSNPIAFFQDKKRIVVKGDDGKNYDAVILRELKN